MVSRDEALKEMARRELARRRAQSPQHPEFDASGIPGYNAETGMVEQSAPQASMPRTMSTVMGAVEGLPVVGPYARQGVEAAAAGIGSALTGQPFGEVRSEMAGMADRAAEQHPNFNLGGQAAGAVAGTLPLVLAAPGAFGAGAGGLLARSAASAASGAALGGADAAVRSGGDLDATKSGALWGGGLGLVAPGVGQLVGKGVGKIAERVRGPAGAERAFGRAAGADAVDDIGARLASMGDDAMPMDLGPNLQRQAGAIAATPGRGQEVVRSAIASRQAGAGSRVAGALDDALGQTTDTLALADDIIAQRSAAAKPLYDAAYAKPMPFSRDLKALLSRPSMRGALRKAEKLAADEGLPSKQWFAKVTDAGSERATGILDSSGRGINAPNPKQVSFIRTPDVRELDLTKRALDDMISTAQRAGNNNEARILIQQKNMLTGMIDDAVPEYAAARKAFSGPTSVLDAMDEGQKAFRNNLTPNQLRTQLMKMGEAEKEAYVQGARAQVADIMGTARNDALAARSAFQKGYNKEKLELLVGKDQAKRLLDSLDAESAFTRTRDVVTGNSETAARAAAMEEVGGASKQPGMFRSALNMRFGDAAADIGDKALGGLKSASRRKSNEELARLLTSKDPKAITRAIKLVQAAQKRGDISAQRARELVQGVTLGSAQRREPLEITVTP